MIQATVGTLYFGYDSTAVLCLLALALARLPEVAKRTLPASTKCVVSVLMTDRLTD